MELVPAAPPLEPLPESPTSPREMDVSDAFLMQAVMDGLMAPGKDGADGSSSEEEPSESESDPASGTFVVKVLAASDFGLSIMLMPDCGLSIMLMPAASASPHSVRCSPTNAEWHAASAAEHAVSIERHGPCRPST